MALQPLAMGGGRGTGVPRGGRFGKTVGFPGANVVPRADQT